MPRFRVANYYTASDEHIVEAENEDDAYYAGKDCDDANMELFYSETIVLERLDDDSTEFAENVPE